MLLRVALILSLFLWPALAGASSVSSDEEHLVLETVCKHYVNRARFKARGADAEFVVTLADGCESAQKSLRDGEPGEKVAAAAFLSRLAEFRDLIIDMNMIRVFGRGDAPHARIGGRIGTHSGNINRVSATGEYLIAHRMGLIVALNAWLDTAPKVAMALRREQ